MITVNGKQIPRVDTVQQLLTQYGLHERIVIVEVNRDIIMKEQYETTRLVDGDIIEIVHFVGGG